MWSDFKKYIHIGITARQALGRIKGTLIYHSIYVIKLTMVFLGFKRIFHKIVARMILNTELFDDSFYLSNNSDVAASGMNPLLHYCAHGDREKRFPIPVFDPAFYINNSIYSQCSKVNTLLHYSLIGRYAQTSTCPWFDTKFYLLANKDVLRSGLDPLLHFIKIGGFEGRSPSSSFDSAWYLSQYPDVAKAGANPLLHYLMHGQREGRQPYSNKNIETAETLPTNLIEPTDSEWAIQPQEVKQSEVLVDIIVPVYKGYARTLRCLCSIAKNFQATLYELIVIDDASPDERLAKALDKLSERGLFRLIRNEVNLGFVKTVNLGMKLHKKRDVILLNSDTEVYSDWVDRLRATAFRHSDTGTVTPLSNNATICSYPHFNRDNPFPLETDYETVDGMARECNAGTEVEAPTAVGFCTYIKRSCIESVGFFDEDSFGKGYGEENDFCQRAIRAGWKNIIAGDVFVRHWGAVSFQGERGKRLRSAMETIRKRYPNYHADVAKFIETDPLARIRERLDIARLTAKIKEKNVLVISHGRGGGAERHVQEDIQSFRSRGVGVFTLRPSQKNTHGVVGHPATGQLPNLQTYDLNNQKKIVALLCSLHITHIHIHSLVDFDDHAPDWMASLSTALGAKLVFNVHDYTAICPRINLVGKSGIYCGEPGETACNQCLAGNGAKSPKRNIKAWRSGYARLFKAASLIDLPDEDVARRLEKYFSAMPISINPHEKIANGSAEKRQPILTYCEKLHVVAIGAISKIKGYDVLLACALDARKRKLPIQFSVLGYGHDDRKLENAGVTITGRYIEEEGLKKLEAMYPHAVWLPSVWPETYSYTLSLALKAGLPVFAFDLGAIANRLRMSGEDKGLMPLELVNRPKQINNIFVDYRNECLSEWPAQQMVRYA